MRIRAAHFAWPFSILLLLVVLAIGTLFVLAATEGGTRWLVARALASTAVPLEIQGVSGTLLRGMRADRFRYQTPTIDVTGEAIELDPDWFGSLANDRIKARRLAVAELTVLRLEQPVTGADPVPIDFRFPELPFVTLHVDHVRVGRFRLDDLEDEWAPALQAEVIWSPRAFQLHGLSAQAPNYSASSTLLNLRLSGDQALAGELEWRLYDGRFAGHALVGGTLRMLEIDHRLDAPQRAYMRGTIALVGQVDPVADLVVDMPELLTDPVRAERVEGTVQGWLGNYRGEMRAVIDVDGRVHGDATAEFSGDLDGVVVRPIVMQGTLGSASARGSIAWRPELVIELDVAAANVDPASLGAPQHGTLAAAALLRYADARLVLDVEQVAGEYGGHALTASGELELVDGIWSTEGLELGSGNNRIAAAGRYGAERLDVQLALMVPEIERLVPAVNGAIQGAVRLAGPLNALDATAHINAPLLTIGDVQLADVVVDIARDDAGARNRMTATAARVDYGPLEMQAVTLGARGDDTRAEVDLSWRLFSEPASRLRADVARNDDRIAVRLHADALLSTPYGAWRLDAPTSIDIGDARLVVSDHCWERAGDVGSVCVELLRRSAGITELAGTIVALPLQWLHVFVEDLPRFAGQLEATWQVRHDAATGTANGQLQWHTQGLGLTEFAVADGDDNGDLALDGVLDLPELVGGVNFHGTGFEATLFAAHNGRRVIDAHLNVSDLPNTRRLDGRATLQLTDLSFVPSLVRDLGSFDGTLVGGLAISGTVAAPELRGNLALEQGSLAWLNPFIELDEVSIRADLDQPNVITLAGTATSDRRGELTVQGRIENPLSPERVATIQIRGRDVLVQIPDSRVYASPDLTLTWRDQQAMLVGTLDVPRGQLVAPELPEAVVARSTDVVVLEREEIVDPALRYAANVRLVIGDDVHLVGFGLTARFGGDTRLVRTVDGVVELHGSVLIREGQFGAYGQTLQIDSGGLTFAGPPTNPYVNARAVRRIERPGGDIVVGILITGELENMESTLISEPPMSEGNALSYLMLGRPLRDSTPGEGDELVGAALALGLSQAAPLIEEIGRTLGLDELTAIGDDTDDLTVIAGKQLTARLFVRYSYHAFLGASAMMLRYELTDRLSLETTASETPGFDIMYRVTE